MAVSAAKRWTPAEISLFDRRRAENVHPKLIAAELGRSVGAVIMRGQKANVRRCQRRIREQDGPRIQIEEQYIVPPPYVLRERDIRHSIPVISVTQLIFADPVEGYSALASRARRISVQDALEICATYTGLPGEISGLARTYEITPVTVRRILDGSFFEKLLTRKPTRHEPEGE